MEARDREPQGARPYADPAVSRGRDVVPFREPGAEPPGPGAGPSEPSGPDTQGAQGAQGVVPVSSAADGPGDGAGVSTDASAEAPTETSAKASAGASSAQAPPAPDGEGVPLHDRARREPALLRDRLHEEMALLRERVPEVNGSVACSVDGLPIASDLRGETEQIGALSSAVLALSGRLTAMADKGSFEETLISGSNGYAVFYAAGPTIVLTVLARPGTNLGLLRLEGRKTAARLAAITSRTSTTH
ncbi:roadblock/LC7 domain-containing protein [Streptosporangium sandarakinum]|uniref:roadblock/LC7 domain-containing protein n=1 Tax=Streptosporangium sandarakinum TaxID=1260955 RepID=UPI003417B272